MADVRVVRTHHLTVPQAKKIAQKTADDLAEEYDLQSQWDGNTLNFERSGVTGCMKVGAHQIELEVTLGFLFKPFRAKFESHISHRLDELLLAARQSRETAAAPASKKTPAKKTPRRN